MNMKLHDDIRPDGPNEREQIIELIPWYVMGALPEEETRRVEAYVEAHPDIAEEVRKERVMAKEVAKSDPFDVPLERSWNTLRAQVEADIAARTPAKRPSGWLQGLQGRGMAVFGGMATACVALAFVIQFNTGPNDDFVTLTSDPGSAVPTIRFQPAGDLGVDALQAQLADLGVIAIAGPSEAGVYTATFAADADIEQIARAMSERDSILFAAPEAGQ